MLPASKQGHRWTNTADIAPVLSQGCGVTQKCAREGGVWDDTSLDVGKMGGDCITTQAAAKLLGSQVDACSLCCFL